MGEEDVEQGSRNLCTLTVTQQRLSSNFHKKHLKGKCVWNTCKAVVTRSDIEVIQLKLSKQTKGLQPLSPFFKLYIFELMQRMSFSARNEMCFRTTNALRVGGTFADDWEWLFCLCTQGLALWKSSRLTKTRTEVRDEMRRWAPKVLRRKGHFMLTCLSLGLPLCLFYSLVAGTFRNCVPSWKLLLPLQFPCKKASSHQISSFSFWVQILSNQSMKWVCLGERDVF